MLWHFFSLHLLPVSCTDLFCLISVFYACNSAITCVRFMSDFKAKQANAHDYKKDGLTRVFFGGMSRISDKKFSCVYVGCFS